MTTISVCICTRRRRDELAELLVSLEKMQLPSNTEVRIVIVENDEENYSEMIVREYALKSRLRIDYSLETKRGIVFARNRSVAESGECDFCCFTDDDQTVSEVWLKELIKCQKEFNADGVAGPTLPHFRRDVLPWTRSFHNPDIYPYGAIVESAFTGCLLLRKSFLGKIEGPFDPRLNFSGGEDSQLTRKITAMGGTIRFNPNAIVYENIPEERTTLRYLVRRTYRRSNTRLFINALDGRNANPVLVLGKLTLRLFNGLAILIPFLLFGEEAKYKGLIKIANAIGGFAFFLGGKSKFYK